MAVVALEIRSRRPYADGVSFGDVGPYERLDGIIRFAVDPIHELNLSVVDLDKAPRDGDGRVTFWSDFTLLAPLYRARGSGRLLFEVLNRGRKNVPRHMNRAETEANPTTDRIDPGDGFLMRHGFSIAWCGWQWDVIRSAALMGLEAPLAQEDGRPIGGQTLIQFQPNEAHRTHLLADRVHNPYPAADLVDPEAVLTVQEYVRGPATVIPRDRWQFAREDGARVVPDDAHVYLSDGFEPGCIYTLAYRTNIAPVAGVGLLAVRDCVSFLRYSSSAQGNPIAGAVERAYGFGVSQSGRFLRHFLYLGMNLDEERRMVFDGIMPHVAGGRRGEFNHRFAQPSVQSTPGFGFLFPFADDEYADAVTGRVDGLLRRQREVGGMPKVFYTNTSAEYWRGDASMIHIDMAGTRDITPPENVRVYLFASTQHGPGSIPLSSTNANDGCRGRHPFNALDYSPLTRAALLNLDAWVSRGQEPPPSAYPRLADGTAVRPADLEVAFSNIPGATFPNPERVLRLMHVDIGPDASRGIGAFPARMGQPYPNFVSAVDGDRNEMAGVRMPDLSVPVTTYTGWNPRHPETGQPDQIIPMQGSTFPFAPTPEARQPGDPRPSIGERYSGWADYLAKVRAAAEKLVEEGYLLAEDIDVVVENAGARYDLFAGHE
ncbi:MAG: alpha/beta hydrolase domain-containing protein [Chloroflexi bacterium]|nr:alpha/beta hydrolase domain-containing protein [Chloroflexota bacterium]